VRFYPCPNDCGCAHEVLPADDQTFTAVCRCESWNCDDLALTLDQILPLELNWPRLGRALATAFGLQLKFAGLNPPQTCQVGSWADAVPVLLTIPLNTAGLRRTILELSARLRCPFILLASTATHMDAAGHELLAGAGAGFFSLAAHLPFAPGRPLHPVQSPGQLFARFNPQPGEALDDNSARRAFALVQQLDSAGCLKPPSLITVFRLYCLDELSAGQIARRLHCSKPTVLRRLQLLRRKTGLDPRALRRYSPHLDRLDQDFSDARARHIHPRNLIYDDAPAND